MPSGKKGQRNQILEEMARKREQRAAKAAYRAEKKNKAAHLVDDYFTSFNNQLAAMGLTIRDIPGDGNCLFRALGDQLVGHGRHHLRHRDETVKYMISHRADFEPFVEDDNSFENHVSNLRKPGTYAGNDAIVAFARDHGVNVYIHQLNTALWQIKGSDKPGCKELHISYHNGDHYSSVRRIGDKTELPANIKLSQSSLLKAEADERRGKRESCDSGYGSLNSNHMEEGPYILPEESNFHQSAEELASIEYIMQETGCQDESLVRQLLEDSWYDQEAALLLVLEIMANSPPLNESECQHNISVKDSRLHKESSKKSPNSISPVSCGARPKLQKSQLSKKQKKELRKLERKQQLQKSPDSSPTYEDDLSASVLNELGCLSI